MAHALRQRAGGTLAVAAVYPLAATLGGARAGLLAALFMALSAFAVTWSQELRMYVWGSLWAPLALYGALAWWQTRRWRWLLLYVFAAAAGLWTLYLFVAVLVVANLAFLVYWQRVRRPVPLLAGWAGAQLAVLALFAPWLAYALPRMMSWSSAEAYSPAFFARLYATVLATGVAERIEPWLIPGLAVFGLLLAGVAALLRQRKSPLQAAGLTLLILGVALPAVLVYALTALPGRQFYVPRLAPRYFLPLASTFYALLGWGIVALRRRSTVAACAGAGLAASVALAGLLALLPGRVATDQYVSLVETLRAHEHPGDRVLLYPDEDWPLFAARYPGEWAKVPAGMDLTADNVTGLLDPVWQGAEGLWVVTTPKAQETDPDGLARQWLEERARVAAEWTFGETKLSFYPRSAARAGTAQELGPGSGGLRRVSSLGGADFAGAFVPLRRYGIGDTLRLTTYWLNPPQGDVTVALRGPATPRGGSPAPGRDVRPDERDGRHSHHAGHAARPLPGAAARRGRAVRRRQDSSRSIGRRAPAPRVGGDQSAARSALRPGRPSARVRPAADPRARRRRRAAHALLANGRRAHRAVQGLHAPGRNCLECERGQLPVGTAG